MEIVEDEGGWAVSVPDLPGCTSFGATPEDTVKNAREAIELWIKSQFEGGGDIPEPTDEDDFSGKFVLRIPRILHRSLAYEARKQGVSLNHYASYLLAQRQPLQAFEHAAQTILEMCPTSKATWLYHGYAHDRALMVGKSVNADLLVYLRKPATKGVFDPEYIRKQRALPEAR